MATKCEHENIIYREGNVYEFPMGYTKFCELPENKKDMGNFFVQGLDWEVYCQDCDTELENSNLN